MITTTLKALRKHDARISGYNKIACRVAGKKYNSERETYVRHRHDEPIQIGVILDSSGFDDALWALRACEQTPEMIRAERLFAVWCARQVQHLMTDARSIAALDVAERHAHGNATDDELAAARSAAWDAAWAAAWDAAMDAAWDAARSAAWDAARSAAWDAARSAAWDAAMDAGGDAAMDAGGDVHCGAAWDDARHAAIDNQSKMFRAVFCGDSINIDALKG